MAGVGKGEWVPLARRLLEETAGMTPSERRRHLEEGHHSGGPRPATAQRAMQALRWLERRARVYGVEIEDVKLAYTGVEALQKLEAARPHQASVIASDALRGRLTARELKEETSTALPAILKTGATPWGAFLMDMIAPVMPPGPVSIAYIKTDLSEWGSILRVDVEWQTGDGANIAVFLSPRIDFAQSDSFDETLPRVIAARTLYDQVYFLTFDEGEADVMLRQSSIEGVRLKPLFVARPPSWNVVVEAPG